MFRKVHFSIFILFLLNICLKGQTFYDINTIQKIEINFTQSNWDYILDTSKAGSDGYLMANWVKINGTYFDSAGVKYKGNSSYNASNNKNPIHIELDSYKNQSYQGYTDIKLGNNYADPSMIREVLGYNLLKNYMHCPKSNFAKLYINGAYYGVYSNAESIGKKFYSERFSSSSNTAIKCNPVQNPGPNTKCNLKYINNDSSSYFNFYELKSNTGWKDLVSLCDTVTNFGSRLENNLDMDRAIWMHAFNVATDNLDSYSGAFCQNYYLYKDNNLRFNPIIWDLNMCFGGLPFVGSGTVSLGSLTIPNLQQMQLNIHSSDIHWPLINQIHANPTYKRMYAAHIKTIMNEMIANTYYQTLANSFQTLIDTSVQSDPFKLYTYSQFQNGMTANTSVGSYSVPGITTLMSARNTYLQALPEFTLAQPSITNIASSPATPSIADTIWITASILNQNYSYLGYRDLTTAKFKKIQLADDGLHHDGAANDGVFGQYLIASSPNMQYYIYSENTNTGKFSPERAEHEFYTLSVAVPTVNKNDVFLNEIMAKNVSVATDNSGKYEDWLEIFNNTNSNLNLSNVFLSSTASNLQKWRFPANTILPAYKIITVWMDADSTQLGYHANYKLSANGGSVFLSNSNNVILDSVSFGPQSADISLRRCPDGTGNWGYTFAPTFNRLNCDVGLSENNFDMLNLKAFPVPANNYIQFFCSTNILKLEIFSIDGKKIMEYPDIKDKSISILTSGMTDGIYFARLNNLTSIKFIIQH